MSCWAWLFSPQTRAPRSYTNVSYEPSLGWSEKRRKNLSPAPLGHLWVGFPSHRHLVGPAVVSIQEPGAGDEKRTGTNLVRDHAELEQELGRPTGSEEEHKRYLTLCIQIYLSNSLVIMGRNWTLEKTFGEGLQSSVFPHLIPRKVLGTRCQ